MDKSRRKFLERCVSALGTLGFGFFAWPFLASWKPSARTQAAGSPVEVDISGLTPGEQLTVQWRGKPVWIIQRTSSMLDQLSKHDALLRDPQSLSSEQPKATVNPGRALRPDIFIAVGICTHLGCVPTYRPDAGGIDVAWPGGFYCPCHGSRFDLAGRVYRGAPAPTNLVIPPHYYKNDTLLVIGSSGETDGLE